MPVPPQLRRTLLLGLVGVTIGGAALVAHGGLGWAADDAGVLEFFRSEARRVEPAPRASAPVGFAALSAVGRGFTALTAPARPTAPKPASTVPSPSAAASAAAEIPLRTVCVRTCDGYLFPLGNLARRADLPAHRAGCASACPGAPTALYTLPAGTADLTRATSLAGQPYARLATAGLHRKGPVAACNCSGPGIPHTPIARDGTLRAGDVVARAEGASAVVGDAGDRRLVEFRQPGALPAGTRRAVDRLTGTSRREFAEVQFRRDLRVRHAALLATRAEAPRIRLASADGFSVLAAPAGFQAVRVVVPSPYAAR